MTPSSVNVNYNAKKVCRVNDKNVSDTFEQCALQKSTLCSGEIKYAIPYNTDRLDYFNNRNNSINFHDKNSIHSRFSSYRHDCNTVNPTVFSCFQNFDDRNPRVSSNPTQFIRVSDANPKKYLCKLTPCLNKAPCSYGSFFKPPLARPVNCPPISYSGPVVSDNTLSKQQSSLLHDTSY